MSEPFRYSELTPPMVGMLRVYRAVEQAYPDSGERATKTLEGYEAWRRRQGSRSPQAVSESSREERS